MLHSTLDRAVGHCEQTCASVYDDYSLTDFICGVELILHSFCCSVVQRIPFRL